MASPMHSTPLAIEKDNRQAHYRPFPIIERRNYFQEYLEVPAMIKLLGLPKHQRILEIGCGPGIALAPLFKFCQPRRLAGIDIDPRFIDIAQSRMIERGIPVELFTGDVRTLPFEAGEFDMIVDFGTCYHISNCNQALDEISRVLSPGGLFVHESPISQLLSHPIRSFGRILPWRSASRLQFKRTAILWSARSKTK